ncbi:hypothetical protein [Cerasicoccus maritimus]|uniref:hypothetical protein n=1 Tax=Cerasicoccus maritimus TaxID=490089 RepID=UPI002852C5A7|nr:hypothetical protein [Cerasicoccus maritimus]
MKNKNPGFALVIALVLMAFMVMLLLSLSTTLMVESNASSVQRIDAEARSNAQFALVQALGELQKLAGPDQRITARADILADDAPYWTGVWSSDPDDEAFSLSDDQTQQEIKDRSVLKWLVSLPNNGELAVLEPYLGRSASSLADDEILMADDDLDGTAVILPKEDIYSEGALKGKYAYWISDEGLKANVSLTPEDVRRANNLDARNPSVMNAASIDGIGALITDLEIGQSQLGATTTLSELPIVLNTDDSILEDYAHDITGETRGLLVNVRDGGFKKDLTAAFEDTEDFQDLIADHGSTQVFDAQGGVANDKDPGGPLWEQLRSYYTQRLNDDGELESREPTDAQSGVYPVIAQFSLHHHLIMYSIGSGQYQPRLCLFPIVVLWNPYDQPIASETYFVKVTDINTYNGAEGMTMEIQPRIYLKEDDGRPDTVTYTNPNNGQVSYYKESDVFPNTSDPLRFELVSPVIEPGEALVFSPSSISKMDSNPATPMPLEVGFYDGEYFYYEDVTPFTLDLLGAEQQIDQFGLRMMSANYLRIRLARESIANAENNVLLQHVSGQNYFVTGSGGGGQGNILWPATDSSLISSAEANQPIIAGHTNYNLATFPAAGAYMHLKLPSNYAEVNNNDDLTDAQREIMPYVRTIANYNPRAPRSSKTPLEQVDYGNNQGSDFAFNPSYFGNTENYHWYYGLPANNSYFSYNHGDERVNFSYTDDPSAITDGGFILYEAPTDDSFFLSVADLAHANLTQPFINSSKFYSHPYKTYNVQNTWPAYAIGNSLQDPRIPAGQTSRSTWPDSNPDPAGYYHYDVSYLLNDALWDGYFFSAYNAADDSSHNARHSLTDDFDLGFATSAAGLYVKGAFNVNSTSVRAWSALLCSAKHAAVESRVGEYDDAATTPFLRVAMPDGEPTAVDRNTLDDAVYNGFLALTDDDIERLAEAIVTQVKERGPFISLSHFVNRVLDSANYQSTREAAYAASGEEGRRAMMVGALQAAIDLSEVNAVSATGSSRFNDENYKLAEPDLQEFYREMDIDASLGDRATGATGYLTQLDLLDVIGPVMSVRSDTFVIHAYGESINALTGETQSIARCKATVQRVAEFVDPLNAATDEEQDLTEINLTFGRQFRIIDFQWID